MYTSKQYTHITYYDPKPEGHLGSGLSLVSSVVHQKGCKREERGREENLRSHR